MFPVIINNNPIVNKYKHIIIIYYTYETKN